MTAYVCHATPDRAGAFQLGADLQLLGQIVWVDRESTDTRWRAILEQIKTCDLFVFAVSPDSLRSRSCQAQLSYAKALQRPILQVMLRPPNTATSAHDGIVDYTQRTPDTAFTLSKALARIEPAGRPPEPAPPEPKDPMSDLAVHYHQVNAPELTFAQQRELMSELRARLNDPDDQPHVDQLLRRLRNRPDLAQSLAVELDATLTRQLPLPGPARRTKKRPVLWPVSIVAALVVIGGIVLLSVVLTGSDSAQREAARTFVDTLNKDNPEALTGLVCTAN